MLGVFSSDSQINFLAASTFCGSIFGVSIERAERVAFTIGVAERGRPVTVELGKPFEGIVIEATAADGQVN